MSAMEHSNGPVIDMTPDGAFVTPPRPGILAYLLRLALFGVALATVAALFWTIILVLPLLILAMVVGFFVFRPRIMQFGPRRF